MDTSQHQLLCFLSHYDVVNSVPLLTVWMLPSVFVDVLLLKPGVHHSQVVEGTPLKETHAHTCTHTHGLYIKSAVTF